MLQIASGMYFRDGAALHETVHRATVYTNAFVLGRGAVDLPIARLLFDTGIADVTPVTVEVVDRLPRVDENGDDSFMVATGGRELVADVAAVLSFTLNLVFVNEVEVARRLVRSGPPVRPGAAPASLLRRTFDAQVLVPEADWADVSSFTGRLLKLRRTEFEAAMRAIRGIVDATLMVADDVTLAYTLYVAALETLAPSNEVAAVPWDALEGKKRKLIDEACDGLTSEQVERIREAVLRADAAGMRRRFQSFVLDHVTPAFYRSEAVAALRPVPAAVLPRALNFAYGVRSRTVHALHQLAPELWAISDGSDTARHEGQTVLSLQGLNRLARHVVREFVARAPTSIDTEFRYQDALPGVVRVEFAPQYWIGRPGSALHDASARFGGFLEMVVPLIRRDDGAEGTDLRSVLAEMQRLVPGEASADKRRPAVALHLLWNRLVPAEMRTPDHDRFLSRFLRDLDPPSIEGFAAGVLLGYEPPWSTAEVVELADRRASELRRRSPRPMPARFDAALHLWLARRLWADSRRAEAVEAVSRAVETVPGSEGLIEFEAAVIAGMPPHADLRAFVLGEDPPVIAWNSPRRRRLRSVKAGRWIRRGSRGRRR